MSLALKTGMNCNMSTSFKGDNGPDAQKVCCLICILQLIRCVKFILPANW